MDEPVFFVLNYTFDAYFIIEVSGKYCIASGEQYILESAVCMRTNTSHSIYHSSASVLNLYVRIVLVYFAKVGRCVRTCAVLVLANMWKRVPIIWAT